MRSEQVSGRAQTDESLRSEREIADRLAGDDLDAVDEAADAVVSRARRRADSVLAAARAKTDRSGSREPLSAALQRSRSLEDHVLQDERATADNILRGERADHVAVLSQEREETDRDLSDERARSDHALARRDEFLGIVSHDLQNMLNAMVGAASFIEILASKDDCVDQIVTQARRVQRAGARMHRIIGDLVDVASIEAGALAVTREISDPALVVSETVETFQVNAMGNGVSLSADIVLPLPRVEFDPSRILQVLSNLVGNAIKFTPAHGRVWVRVEHVGDDVLFCVQDTGTGIPADKLDVVFERFVQLTKNDRRGVGLGLFISKCIVEGHGGRIWATAGNGGAFCFTLPVTPSS